MSFRAALPLSLAHLAATLLVAAPTLHGQSIVPFAGRTYDAGSSLRDVQLANLDGQAGPDLVMLCETLGSSVLKLRLNQGDEFGFLLSPLSTGNTPVALATGDWGGSPEDDLAYTNFGSDTATVALSNGTGGFASFENLPMGDGPNGVVLADLDGDGDRDLLVSNTSATGGVTARLRGATWGPAIASPTGTSLYALTVGDLDGDGELDAVAGFGSGLSIQLGGPGATFGTDTLVLLGLVAYSVQLADVDLDGDLDALATGLSEGRVVLLYGDGAGGLDDPQELPAVLQPGDGLLPDLDGDGSVDLAVVSGTSAGTLQLRRGSGAGGFGPLTVRGVGHFTSEAVAGDVDLDGRTDLLVGNFSSVSVVLGDGSGDVVAPAEVPTAGEGAIAAVGAADMDEDGRLDLIAGQSEPAEARLLRGDGAGGFAGSQLAAFGTPATDVAATEFSGEGHADLVFATSDGGNNNFLVILLGNGAGGLTKQKSFKINFPLNGVTVVDTTDDGVPDVVGPGHGGLRSYVNNGAGTFSDLGWAGPNDLSDAGAGDFDEDGHEDVASCVFDDSLALLRGLGNGGFAAATLTPLPTGVFDDGPVVRALDIDGDGHVDAIVKHGQAVRRYLGNGAGAFVHATDAPTTNWVGDDLALADFDLDGALDAALVGGDVEQGLACLHGDGAGGFEPVAYAVVCGKPSRLAVGDFNGDGRPDLATASNVFEHPFLGVHLNDAPADPWTTTGPGLAGTAGVPVLDGGGVLLAGQTVHLDLACARPVAPATLVLGLGLLGAPFKGGVLVPQPNLIVGGPVTDGAGELQLAAPWPAGLPGGLTLVFQHWIADAAAPQGLSASNGLVLLTP